MNCTEYKTKQSFVNSGYKLINVKRHVAQIAFESFTEESINPGFITLGQLTGKGWQCICDKTEQLR